MAEADFMRRCLKRATELGARLFRNNTGVLEDKRGVPVRFGLHPGSGDLIGWTPVTITPEMVGQTVAVFTSVETKSPRGRPTKEQVTWAQVVASSGGLAGIARTDDDLDNILRGGTRISQGIANRTRDS